MLNPIGTKGQIAHAFAGILHDMWQGGQTYLTPVQFRVS
jgi:ubiquitin carboxyl-terminal hydrolase 8